MAFSLGGGSYRWVYVPATGPNPMITNLPLQVGEKGDKKVVYPALNMASPDTVKQWDITVPYALVEAEVNDGAGAPADEAFTATKMKRVDDTKAFPLNVPDAVADARKRYQEYVKGQQKATDDALADEQKAALKDRKPTGPRETAELFYITWMPDSEHLIVRFRTTITDGAYQYGTGVPPVGPFPLPPPPKEVAKDAPPAAGPQRPPPPPPPRGEGVRFGTTFGVEFGVEYQIDKTGKVDKVLTLPTQAFHRELPPPPGAGGPRGPADPRESPARPGPADK
jgi:hypothetical protein